MDLGVVFFKKLFNKLTRYKPPFLTTLTVNVERKKKDKIRNMSVNFSLYVVAEQGEQGKFSMLQCLRLAVTHLDPLGWFLTMWMMRPGG